MTRTDPVNVRPARAGEGGLIHAFVLDLARYERLEHDVQATPESLETDLFMPSPRVFCDIAEHGGDAVGMALWFYNYSTFLGRSGIYLEDLFVRPEARGGGAGLALLSGLARRCMDERLGRLEWSVLDWNEPALGVYRSIGAQSMNQWTAQRLAGDALARLAARN